MSRTIFFSSASLHVPKANQSQNLHIVVLSNTYKNIVSFDTGLGQRERPFTELVCDCRQFSVQWIDDSGELEAEYVGWEKSVSRTQLLWGNRSVVCFHFGHNGIRILPTWPRIFFFSVWLLLENYKKGFLGKWINKWCRWIVFFFLFFSPEQERLKS